jgi:hypothetical protein
MKWKTSRHTSASGNALMMKFLTVQQLSTTTISGAGTPSSSHRFLNALSTSWISAGDALWQNL